VDGQFFCEKSAMSPTLMSHFTHDPRAMTMKL
jgi:hypothetical protein